MGSPRDERPRESAAGRMALAILTAAAAISIATVVVLGIAVLTGRVPDPATLSTATPATSPAR